MSSERGCVDRVQIVVLECRQRVVCRVDARTAFDCVVGPVGSMYLLDLCDMDVYKQINLSCDCYVHVWLLLCLSQLLRGIVLL